MTNIFFGFFFSNIHLFCYFSVSFCYFFWSNLLWRLGLSVKSWNSQHKEIRFIYWILHTALLIYCWRIKASKWLQVTGKDKELKHQYNILTVPTPQQQRAPPPQPPPHTPSQGTVIQFWLVSLSAAIHSHNLNKAELHIFTSLSGLVQNQFTA